MLPDDELKVLRVLWNLYRNEWARPDMKLLTRYSRRSGQRVRSAIRGLKAQGYVEEARGFLPLIKDGDNSLIIPSKTRYWMD